MNRYFKLVNFEINRFFKLYLVLTGLTAAIQISGVIVESRQYLKWIQENIVQGTMKIEEFLDIFGEMSLFDFIQSGWFTLSIVLCIVVLSIYSFFIWYRDWYGKNSFIYRALALPAKRINLFLSKGTVILLFVMGLVSLQLILLAVEKQIIQWLIPEQFRLDMPILEVIYNDYLAILYPPNIFEFILYYGLGLTAVFIIFTAILFERCYRLKGVFYGLLYAGLSVLIFLSPLLVNDLLLDSYFFPNELFWMLLTAGLIVLAASIFTSRTLLKRKIRV